MIASGFSAGDLAGLPVLEILKLGASGFCFLLAFLGYLLLRKEQSRGQIRSGMVSAIHNFLNFSIVLGALVAAAALIPVLKRPPQVTTEHAPSVPYAEEYPAVMGAVSNLLSKKPFVCRKSSVVLEFSETEGQNSFLIQVFSTREIFNPCNTDVEMPYWVLPNEGDFQSSRAFEFDPTKPDHRGRCTWSIDKPAFSRLPATIKGGVRRVDLTTLVIPVKKTLILEQTYTLNKPFIYELPLCSRLISLEGEQVTVNSAHLRHGFQPHAVSLGMPSVDTKIVSEGPNVTTYRATGVTFPGNGIILSWRYSPN
jgi:hypothetical protein